MSLTVPTLLVRSTCRLPLAFEVDWYGEPRPLRDVLWTRRNVCVGAGKCEVMSTSHWPVSETADVETLERFANAAEIDAEGWGNQNPTRVRELRSEASYYRAVARSRAA